MSSSSVSCSAAPWRGAAAATARGRERASAPVARLHVGRGPVSLLPGAAAILALWIALWSFFILAVAAPAAQLHRASASQPVTAVAEAEPQGDRGP